MLPFHPVPFRAVNFLKFAIEMASHEGKATMTALPILSLTAGMKGGLRHFVPNMQIVG